MLKSRKKKFIAPVMGLIAPLFGVTQPWIKGYNGEGELGAMNRVNILAYLWIDKE